MWCFIHKHFHMRTFFLIKTVKQLWSQADMVTTSCWYSRLLYYIYSHCQIWLRQEFTDSFSNIIWLQLLLIVEECHVVSAIAELLVLLCGFVLVLNEQWCVITVSRKQYSLIVRYFAVQWPGWSTPSQGKRSPQETQPAPRGEAQGERSWNHELWWQLQEVTWAIVIITVISHTLVVGLWASCQAVSNIWHLDTFYAEKWSLSVTLLSVHQLTLYKRNVADVCLWCLLPKVKYWKFQCQCQCHTLASHIRVIL